MSQLLMDDQNLDFSLPETKKLKEWPGMALRIDLTVIGETAEDHFVFEMDSFKTNHPTEKNQVPQRETTFTSKSWSASKAGIPGGAKFADPNVQRNRSNWLNQTDVDYLVLPFCD